MSIFPLGNTRTENEVKIGYCAMWRDRETLRNMGPTLDCFKMSPKFYHFLNNRLIYQETPSCYFSHLSTVMCCLTTEIHSETFVVRWFCRVTVTECTYTNPGGTAYQTLATWHTTVERQSPSTRTQSQVAQPTVHLGHVVYHRRVTVTKYTYTNPGGTAYCTPRPHGIPLSCSCVTITLKVPTSIPAAPQMSDSLSPSEQF